MNFLDVIIIIVMAVITLIAIFLDFICIQDKDYGGLFGIFFLWIFVLGMVSLPFWVIDKHSGMTKGVVTSVDENFFGTTAIYIKTSETTQEKYCIEDPDLAEMAYGVIGQEVTIKYGKRIGLYSTGKCSQSPVEYIGVSNAEK